MPHPYFDVPVPTIIGHRGAAGSAPENTLPSFERALELGAHILESDLHVTRDGVPVLIHDPDVERVCEGQGRVEELDLAELKKLDAAHYFSPYEGGGFPMRDQGIAIPTLAEAFEAFPEARFNLEIKASPPELVTAVLALIGEYERSARTLLTAGDDPVMAELRRQLSAARGGANVTPAIGASLADILACVQAALSGSPPACDSMALQIPADFGGDPLVTQQLVDHLHAHGIAIHVWTINEPEEMHRLLDLGVDGLVTDHPERMAAVLAQRA